MNKLEAHKILGTNDSMSSDDIKKAYRKLASKHHPDKNKGKEEEAKQEFQKVQAALDVLEGKTQPGPQPSQGNPFQGFNFNFGNAGGIDINDILRNFHGGGYHDWAGSGPGAAPRGPSVYTATVGITMSEAFHGVVKTLEIPDPNKISGVPTQVQIPAGVSELEVIKEIKTPESVIRVMVKIHSEYQITFGNLLNQGTGDIYKEHLVNPLLMITGGFLEFPTIDGTTVSTRIPAGIEANTMLKLKGKGYWTSQKCEHRGDCLLRITPHIQKLENMDKKVLQEFVEAAKKQLETK